MGSLKRTVKKIVGPERIEFVRTLASTASVYSHFVRKDGSASHPRSVTIDLTFKCTCRCVMCSLYGDHRKPWTPSPNQQELTRESWCEVLSNLREFGVQDVCFTGGEPLLRSDLLDLLRHARSLGLSTNVLTSGSLLTKELADALVAVGLNDISVSIDGPREVHNRIRRRDCYDSAVSGLNYLQEAKRATGSDTPNLTIACTMQKTNESSFAELVGVAEEVRAVLCLNPLFFAAGQPQSRTPANAEADRAKDENQSLLDSHRMVDVAELHGSLEKARRLARERKVKVFSPFENKEDIYRRFYVPEHSVVNKCFQPWMSARIDPYGTVYPCSLNVACGRVPAQRFSEIWNNEAYRRLRLRLRKNRLLPGCEKCCVLTPQRKIWNYFPGGF